VRVYFLRWKERDLNEQLKVELNEEGPVREQIFNHNIHFTNIISLMKQEGYAHSDIIQALKSGQTKQNGLILKSLSRMQHYNEDLYVKPKMFDRWREYVNLRKLFR
jgi:hypothetical protein